MRRRSTHFAWVVLVACLANACIGDMIVPEREVVKGIAMVKTDLGEFFLSGDFRATDIRFGHQIHATALGLSGSLLVVRLKSWTEADDGQSMLLVDVANRQVEGPFAPEEWRHECTLRPGLLSTVMRPSSEVWEKGLR